MKLRFDCVESENCGASDIFVAAYEFNNSSDDTQERVCKGGRCMHAHTLANSNCTGESSSSSSELSSKMNEASEGRVFAGTTTALHRALFNCPPPRR